MTSPRAINAVAPPHPSALPRLLPSGDRPRGLAEHLERFGPMPYRWGQDGLLDAIDDAALTGRGGAGFPTARKWAAVAAATGPRVVVGNGSEGEPASRKDRALLRLSPHLVLDGLQLAAEAVDADTLYLYVPPDSKAVAMVERALAERSNRGIDHRPVTVVVAEDRFIAGEESAVAAALSGQPGLPRGRSTRVFERGVNGQPTLVQNVETLAHIALIGRHGAEWYRGAGTSDEPGTVLLTIGGLVRWPGVTEAAAGARLTDVLEAGGGATAGIQAVLIGGYHGTWVRGSEVDSIDLSRASLAAHGARVGAGVVIVLPDHACGLIESARVIRYLADESSGQCGPCVFGLADIATAVEAMSRGTDIRHQLASLQRWLAMVDQRGACSHPDGSARFVRSTLEVFADETRLHEIGRCRAGGRSLAVLPVADRAVCA
jgi:NADH:ubiquinone oxidoreductase subunit F (NADH-binding)